MNVAHDIRQGAVTTLDAEGFEIACRRFGLNGHGAGRRPAELDCSRFHPPAPAKDQGPQMALF